MTQTRLKRLLILNIPYVLIGLYATKLAEAWRLAEGTEISEKLLHLMDGFLAAFRSPWPSFVPSDLLLGVALGCLLRLAVYEKSRNAKKYRRNAEYYIGDGGRIAYIRVGNESVQAAATDLKRLVLRGSNSTYDSLPTLYRFEGFAFTKLRSVYRQRTGLEMDAQDFVSFGLVDEKGFLTHAGALLADESPMRFSRLFCTRWNGLDKASGVMEALDDKEFSGSLITLLQNGEDFVRNNTKKRWKKTDTGRTEMPDYPERAVLECLVNALIHRDYMITGSEVHIDIFDDRMEIYSPGGMMDGSRVQELNTDYVPSKRRNPVIADVFSRMNYMERRGSGFKKLKADYYRAVNFREALEPQFYSDRTNFIVTLFNLNYGVEVGKTGKQENRKTGNQKGAVHQWIHGLHFKQPTLEKITLLY